MESQLWVIPMIYKNIQIDKPSRRNRTRQLRKIQTEH